MPKPETLARQQSKERILRIAQKGGDWKTVADALEVNYKTAWLWVSQARKADLLEKPTAPKLPWGGKRAEKIKPEHLEFLDSLIAHNCVITLREMAEALLKEFELKVVQQTIQKRLHCRMYSLPKVVDSKKQGQQQHIASLEQQKLARRAYAVALEELAVSGKRLFYVDETNYNIWCAKKMARCRNMHVLACLSADGVALWEHASGALQPEDMNAFVRRALDTIDSGGARHQIPLVDIALVVDHSSCFSRIDELLAEERYRGVTLVRLPLFSAMLNPCESVFANFRAAAKQFLHANEQRISNTPESTSIIEHRTSFLVRAAVELFPQASTAHECAKSVERTRVLTHEALRADAETAAGSAQKATAAVL